MKFIRMFFPPMPSRDELELFIADLITAAAGSVLVAVLFLSFLGA